jgi:hypothetical protein
VLGDPMTVDPARHVDEVEVRDGRERRTAREDEARGQEGQVERLAVVGDEHRGARHPLGEPLEHGRLLAELAQEELLDHERPSFIEPSEPDEKRHRARAARKTGRLGVDVHRAGWVTRDQSRVEREQREHFGRRISSHMHGRATYSVRGRESLRSNVDRTRRGLLASER